MRLCIIVDNSCDFLDNLSVLRRARGKRRKGKSKNVEELSTHPLFADNFIHKKIEFIHSEFPVIGLLFLLISYIMIARLKKGSLFEAGYTQFYTIYYYIYQLKENNINKVLPQRERVGKKSAERTGGGRYENHL